LKRRRPQPASTDIATDSSQAVALHELRRLLAAGGDIELLGDPSMIQSAMVCPLRIATGSLERGEGGLKVQAFEDVLVAVDASYPVRPPRVEVLHDRWLMFPHVMQGSRLCVFLDHDREWDPAAGMACLLNRLWTWFEDAVAGRFDPRTSLYHGVGGVQHVGQGAQTLVVAAPLTCANPGIYPVAIRERSARRLDLVAWGVRAGAADISGLAVVADGALPWGVGTTLPVLLENLASPRRSGAKPHLPSIGFPDGSMLEARLRLAARDVAPGERLCLVVAGRNPSLAGPEAYDLVAAMLDFDCIEAAGLTAAGSANLEGVDPLKLQFLRMDDVRPEIVTRRDDGRPVSWFEGKTVELWGCGALGSWIAELLVRGGVERLVLRDSAIVTRGLLVRQNYREMDVGSSKSLALAERLRLLSDDVDVQPEPHGDDAARGEGLPDCDVLIDATVNVRVASALDHALAAGPTSTIVAQVATDSESATLGILTVVPGESGAGVTDVDATLRARVDSDPALEAFQTLWHADEGVLFAPARGCSTPTFRGSGADAMSIASAAVSLLGPACEARVAGGYLFALPYTSNPGRTWVGYQAP
jgi:hypothetical protein